MNCQQMSNSIQITSTTSSKTTPQLDLRSVRCDNMSTPDDPVLRTSGEVPTAWRFTATLLGVSDGVYQISLNNVSASGNANVTTRSHDHFLLRVGQNDNPMVFPSANYTSNLLYKEADGSLFVSHKAAGADMFRYSLNFGTTYSDWELYPSGSNPKSKLDQKIWSGTELQDWEGEHVIVQYWSRLVGSSDHVQHADLDIGTDQRQFPHAFLEGAFNQYGFDRGIANQMRMSLNNTWSFDFVQDLPAQVSLNVWGINPDDQPDKTRVYGDIDGDYVLDRIPPYSLINNVINITDSPPSPFLSWRLSVNDADFRYQLTPIGSRWNQLILYILLWTVPIVSGAIAIWIFMKSFYSKWSSPVIPR